MAEEKKKETATEDAGKVEDVKSPEQNKAQDPSTDEKADQSAKDLGIDTPAEAARKSAKAFERVDKAQRASEEK
jgi:hypothetical protein